MKRIKQIILAAAMVFGIGLFALPSTAGAIDVFPQCTNGTATDTAVCGSKGDQASSFVKTLVNTLLFILGAISVVVIIVGGITFATSGGNEAGVKRAKSMITYSLVGLVVAFCAYAIVNWVIKQL